MNEHLFFNMDGEMEEVSRKFFSSIGMAENIQEGSSLNSSTGVYYSCSVFGVEIRLEGNCYDYDDEYAYMVAIKNDFLSDLVINEDAVNHITAFLLQLLIKNLNVPIAYEVGNDRIEILLPGG